MTTKRIMIIVLSAMAGIILAFVLNFSVLDRILIPDPCYYHSNEPGKIFGFFYGFPPAEGGHPFPTRFNYFFTLIIGLMTGVVISRIATKKKA